MSATPERAGEASWRSALRRIGTAAIAWDLGDETVFLAEELVAQAWSLGERQRIALALLVLALGAAERQGSTCLPLAGDPLARTIAALVRAAGLEVDPARVVREIRALCDPARPQLVSLIGGPGEDRPLIATGGNVASHRMHRAEQLLQAALRARLGARRVAADEITAAMDDVVARPSLRGGVAVALSDEQREAVEAAAARALAVVSGGPGTGKTAIAVAVCRVLARTGATAARIALAAPTGKAAQRLGSSVRAALAAVADPAEADHRLAADLPEARTLHRLLGFDAERGRFRHHAQAPLLADVVIVDEASMIDLAMMERLVRALGPDTRLVLLGDADQLPSVEAGAVLRDLCAAGERDDFARRLTRSYRMDGSDPSGRAVLEAAGAVRAGRAEKLLHRLPVSAATELAYAGVERLEPAAGGPGLARLVDAWFGARVAAGGRFAELAGRVHRFAAGAPSEQAGADLAELFALFETSRILCATRRLPGGADALNHLFHLRAAAELDVPARGDRVEFLAGEPVVVRENDYARGLFNGDSGVVVRVGDGHRAELRAVFPALGSWRALPIDALRARLDRGFALTVHQSQGSEYDHVALVLPQTDLPLATRELVYTALTRARRSVAVVGAPDVLRAAIARTAQRHSSLVL